MTHTVIISAIALACTCSSGWAQKSKAKVKTSAAPLSNAEKMGYARTNTYWGPGTYYAFAPGTPWMKMVNNQESAMRDLTGISREDCLAELAKQGFTTVPSNEMEKWFNPNKSKSIPYFYSPDKRYILAPGFVDMEKSAQQGYMPYASKSITRYLLLPKQDSAKVVEMVWQYLRDLRSMKVVLSSFSSTFKKANPKAFPIEKAGTSGWNSLRAGSFLLRMVDGKPSAVWTRNEDIVRRTIGNPEFELRILAMESDYWYSMHVTLQKEGYVIAYDAIAVTMLTLEPSASWVEEHKRRVAEAKAGELMDKQAVEQYKKSPLPPVMEDLNKLLHVK